MLYSDLGSSEPVIKWPENPKDGDEFVYLDRIGGCAQISWVYFMGTWQLLERN